MWSASVAARWSASTDVDDDDRDRLPRRARHLGHVGRRWRRADARSCKRCADAPAVRVRRRCIEPAGEHGTTFVGTVLQLVRGTHRANSTRRDARRLALHDLQTARARARARSTHRPASVAWSSSAQTCDGAARVDTRRDGRRAGARPPTGGRSRRRRRARDPARSPTRGVRLESAGVERHCASRTAPPGPSCRVR